MRLSVEEYLQLDSQSMAVRYEYIDGQVYQSTQLTKMLYFQSEMGMSIWGRGYATEAAALAYGFQLLQRERIVGVTQETNQASQHVLEKLGMRHVHSFWMWDAPQRFYELTREEAQVSIGP